MQLTDDGPAAVSLPANLRTALGTRKQNGRFSYCSEWVAMLQRELAVLSWPVPMPCRNCN